MRHTFQIFLCFFLLMTGAAAVGAADWYVAAGGSGNGSGSSWTNAWNGFRNIRWGAGGVQPGDTLYISGGSSGAVYRETLSVPIKGTSSSRITIRTGQDAGHNGLVVLDGGLSLATGIVLNAYVTLDGTARNGKIGLRIQKMTQKGISAPFADDLPGIRIKSVEIADSGTEQSGNTKPGYAHGIHFLNVRDTEISYTVIHGSYKDGINLGGSSGQWGSNRIHHNHIYDNGDDGITGGAGMDVYNNLIHGHWNLEAGHPDGVQILGNYARIYNNIIYNNVNAQIFWDPTVRGQDAAHARIYNNLVYLSGSSVGGFARGIAVKAEKDTTGVSDLVIANNTVVDQGYFGIGVAANGKRAADITIVNNIVYNNGIRSNQAITVYNYSSASNVRIDYNQVNAGPGGNGVINFGGAFRQAHDNAVRPEFVSHSQRATTNNFRISGNAGAGADMSSYFTTDLDGGTRTSWTPGCYIPGRSGSGSSIVGLPGGTDTSEIPAGSSGPSSPGPGGAPAAPKGFRILQ